MDDLQSHEQETIDVDYFGRNIRGKQTSITEKKKMGGKVMNDLFLHAQSPGFDYSNKATANEFQIMPEPSSIKISDRYKTLANGEYDYEIVSISPLMISNNDVVTVTFRATNASKYDWIGAYSPADVDITQVKPVKYAYCSTNSSYLQNSVDYYSTRPGEGSLTFNFTNLRADIRFYYFNHSAGTSTSSAETIMVANYTEPVKFFNYNEQIKPRVVAMNSIEDTNSFQLLWSSNESTTSPTLKWGLTSGDYTNIVSAVTTTIDKSVLCGAPANTYGYRDLGPIHTATFLNVRNMSVEYIYYIFGDSDSETWSQEYKFRIPPMIGQQPPDRGTTIILFDDLGRGSLDHSYTWNEYGRPSIYTAMSIGEEINLGNVDAIYHGGDISYATGYLAVWDFFMEMMSPLTGKVLYLTTVGNHEADWYNVSYYQNHDSGGECAQVSTKLYPMPYPASASKPWWSYDIGLIHFIGMSTEQNYTVGSEQWLWLKADLESVDREKTPWIIFGGHRAMCTFCVYLFVPCSHNCFLSY